MVPAVRPVMTAVKSFGVVPDQDDGVPTFVLLYGVVVRPYSKDKATDDEVFSCSVEDRAANDASYSGSVEDA